MLHRSRMPFLGLDALQWFVAIDVGIFIASASVALALFVKLNARARERRRLQAVNAPMIPE